MCDVALQLAHVDLQDRVVPSGDDVFVVLQRQIVEEAPGSQHRRLSDFRAGKRIDRLRKRNRTKNDLLCEARRIDVERHVQQGKPSIASCLCDRLYPWFDQVYSFRTLYNPFRENGQVRTVQQTLILV